MQTVEVVNEFNKEILRDILFIHRNAFSPEWVYIDDEVYYRMKLRDKNSINILLNEDELRIGHLLAIPHNDVLEELKEDDTEMKEDSMSYYIETVAILPDFRGRKGFSQMLEHLIHELKMRGIHKLSLHARVLNNLSTIIQNKLRITEIRRIDKWKYHDYKEPTDYIEAVFDSSNLVRTISTAILDKQTSFV
ncbi:MAG: GNAT family N-acetyltransferase [Nitrospirae bacterium]|nr:GNAT family N-acetyltransferase [Nitrospirota bacterium]